MLMVLLLLGLLGVAMGGLLATILSGAQTSGAMIERRRTFYACDGMGRQLAALGQGFLSRNTLEDVPEPQMEAELRALLPRITPPGFEIRPEDLVIPERRLLEPQPLEMITTGPFAGLEVKLQTIEMRFEARREGTGSVCRAEQTLSLGRIAFFQFFVFADLPLVEIATQADPVIMRGRMHANGRLCLSGAPVTANRFFTGRHAVRLDGRVTAVERILHGADGRCGFGGGDVALIGNRAPGSQVPGAPDRLFVEQLLEPLTLQGQSGCTHPGCPGGWRSFALGRWIGRVQDIDHEVQELTLPVDPPVRFTHLGWAADGRTVLQQMTASSSRPNTRFLVEPVLAGRDPPGFSRNKLADKAQIRIIDGVWYVKDPGADNSVDRVDDDGPWPGIPIWSDHPGEFTTATPAMGAEGMEGTRPLQVGQSDIRHFLEDTADPRLERAKWSRRLAMRASPTPRRFSHYAFVDRDQADDADARLHPAGPGLQFGRVLGPSGLDVDPPAVVSYGGIAPIALENSPTSTYWVPGLRLTDNRPSSDRRDPTAPRPDSVGFCGGRSDAGAIPGIDDVEDNDLVPAIPRPFQRVASNTGFGNPSSSSIPTFFPAPSSPLPGDGVSVRYQPGVEGWATGRLCQSDDDEQFRRRMRLALLEATRTGFKDTHSHADTRFANANPPQDDILPININLHALQEALADQTPGELGSYFCEGCLWERFNGTVWIGNTWRGSMLSLPFPDGAAAPPPSPVVDDVALFGRRRAQPKVPNEGRSTTGPLPYPLCAADSDESSRAFAQVVGHRFLEADEVDATTGNLRGGFTMPFAGNASLNRFERGVDAPTRPTLMSPPEAPPASPFVLPRDLVAPPPEGMRTTFVVPHCAHYSLINGPLAAVRPTAVRLINGRTLNFNRQSCGPGANQRCHPELSTGTVGSRSAEGVIPDGLNIITNAPLYVVGDVNMTSEIEQVQTGQKATDWIPFMVAGDTVATLSNSWSDHGSRWGVGTGDGRLSVGLAPVRQASSTTYNMLVLGGVAGSGVFAGARDVRTVGVSGGGIIGAMRLMENWAEAVHRFRGSLVLGWFPVYTQWRQDHPDVRSFRPPALRDWQFDRHLNATVNQPPDSPVFDVTALRSWRRE
jgi:hypothetical protein